MDKDNVAGTVRISKEGLYYHIQCICDLPDNDICRLTANTDSGQMDLGVCVPMGNKFGLDTRVSVRKFGGGEPRFWILRGKAAASERYIPIIPELQFDRIEVLKKARLTKQDGNLGILYSEQN